MSSPVVPIIASASSDHDHHGEHGDGARGYGSVLLTRSDSRCLLDLCTKLEVDHLHTKISSLHQLYYRVLFDYPPEVLLAQPSLPHVCTHSFIHSYDMTPFESS
jgi:hypothetical protein